jgi:transposase IS66-like protein
MITTTTRCAGALVALAFGSILFAARAGEQKTTTRPHDLLVWAGDRAGKGNDFLIVINADPASPDYGHMVTTLATDQQTVRVHHTEYTMPASGMLFANDHDVGRGTDATGSELQLPTRYGQNDCVMALGRRNWLFADTTKGAEASAALYSLTSTAKANGLEPYAYLCRLFAELPQATTVEEIEALLPFQSRSVVTDAKAA